ncbi:MAG TPA: hypothetical protein VFQ60_01690 [Patescibacteria group bacterium]|nr:hypothetical protein [Patescibacteria group bacterium]
MANREQLSQKLFLLKEISGSLNLESIDIKRELEARFKPYSWFIGLALMGSNIRGYNTKTSDLDLKIFYDGSKISNTELARVVKQNTRAIEEAHKFHADKISIPYFVDVNFSTLEKGIRNPSGRENFKALLVLKDLSGLATGEKIKEIRKKIKDIISRLSDQQRQTLGERIVEYAIKEEMLGEEKLMQRLKMSEQDMESFWKKRKSLWERRVSALWT